MCCFYYSTLLYFFILSLNTFRSQQKVINVHSQYTMLIIIGSNDILGNDDLFKRVINLTEGAYFLARFSSSGIENAN